MAENERLMHRECGARRSCKALAALVIVTILGATAALIDFATAQRAAFTMPDLGTRLRPLSLSRGQGTRAASQCAATPRKKGSTDVDKNWFLDSAGGRETGTQKDLKLTDATRVLMALGSVVASVGLADSLGIVYVADVFEVLDAQALITQGQAAAASIVQEGDLTQMQLLLRDGTERMIRLFAAAA
ncbi:unnamed protein product [Polarella glacialis]|uniref:Uncharacterized protein n=1 Tax=Polarella glacialis TaxID=89957 RepID=A0A813DHW7_POLGL|nr:unnamed protein product [Polarella glacialis]